MIQQTAQTWEVGEAVKVGFMKLIVRAKIATPGDIEAVRAELARRQAAIEAWHAAHPLAVYDDSHTWGSRHPELCHLIRRAGDLEGWLAVAESGPVRHTAQEVMA